jgi:molecular chaperone DnaJ
VEADSVMPRDPYEVLGLRRDASPEEIRRAYRHLAKQHHPDVNKDDPAADHRFKDINEAYEVLSDSDKRAAYDRFGHAGLRGFGGVSGNGPGYGGFGDLGDIFDQFFGFGTRARTRPGAGAEAGDDIRTKVRLAFEEAVFGTTKPVEVVRRESCDTCRGSGSASGSRARTCSACHGTGQVRQVQQSVFGSFVNIQTCPSCRGEGEVIEQPCTACGGQGQLRRPRTLDVDIPAGVDTGLQVRLAGEGDQGRRGGPAGDLLIALEVSPHAHFVRDGEDVHVEVQVNVADAALGAQIEVPTLEGRTTLEVPPGTQTGDMFRIGGNGVPRLRRGGRGDQVVTVSVMTPRKINREQRELLERLRATLPAAEVVSQGKGTIWDRVREHFS